MISPNPNYRMGGYTLTKIASYVGYVVQAITINFTPLLFVCFMREFSLSIEEVSALVALTFTVQFAVDFLSVFLVRRISYRVLILIAHVLSCLGLLSMAILPSLMPAFWGLCISIVVYSSGSGFIEVVVSPIIESCPSKNKAAQMSLLHSFYCWGQVATVGVSTLFFAFFGVESWRWMTLIWACVPFCNFFCFLFCPLDLEAETQKSRGIRSLFSSVEFILLMLVITCSGAAEIAVSQWASAYCETALGVSKTVGDIIGPMAFAVCMGVSRLGYSLFAQNFKLERVMLTSSLLCVAGYLVVSLSPYAWLGLVGFGICGLAVGVLWPGAFSLASRHVDGGGTMYALLSFSGDAGCTLGPLIAGICASYRGDDIGFGISCATVFPALLCVWMLSFIRIIAKRNKNTQKTA